MRAIQFSGLYQFQVPKHDYEVELDALQKKYEKKPFPSRAHQRVTWELDRYGETSSPLPALKVVRETTIDGQPGYEGALISGADVQAFWITQFPDVFTSERFDEYRELAQDDKEKLHKRNDNQKALEELVLATNEAKRSVLLTLPGMKKWLFPLLFPEIAPEFEERAEQKPKLVEASQRSFKAVGNAEEALRADAKRMKAENPQQFEDSIFDYVAQHPTDADGQPRQTRKFSPGEVNLRI